MISPQSHAASRSTAWATKAAPITPIGFRLERKGPSTRRRMRSSGPARSRALRLSSWPKSRLLISYRGLKAGRISASEVLIQTSRRSCCPWAGGAEGLPGWAAAKSSSKRKLLRAFTSRERSKAAALRSPWTLIPWLITKMSIRQNSSLSSASWPQLQVTCSRAMGLPSEVVSSRGSTLVVRATRVAPQPWKARSNASPRLPLAPVMATRRPAKAPLPPGSMEIPID